MHINLNLLPWRAALTLKQLYYFGIQLLLISSIAFLIWWRWHQLLQQQLNFEVRQTNHLKQQLALTTNKLHSEEKLKQQHLSCQKQLDKIKQLKNSTSRLIKFLQNCIQGEQPIFI